MGILNLSEVSLPVFILISIFSISSWADVVGLWVEMPLMINELPEGWSLPSYMSLVVQLANVGPFVYFIGFNIYSRQKKAIGNDIHNKTDIILTFAIISMEILSMFLMSLFWNTTNFVGGKNRSTTLLLLLFCSGLCSCLSSLVFLPYMARYPEHYISAYYVGNGLCGIIPGLIGLSQGVGGEPKCVNATLLANESCGNISCEDPQQFQLIPKYHPPNFSVQVYLIIMCCLLAISLISFYCLNYTKLVQHQISKNESDKNQRMFAVMNELGNQQSKELTENCNLMFEMNAKTKQSPCELIYLLFMTGIVNAVFFGAIPSILPFSCLPYGNVTYNLSLRLSHIVGAFASISNLYIPQPNGKVMTAIVSVGLLSSAYHVILALQSPHPILHYEIAGSFLVVSFVNFLQRNFMKINEMI